MSLASGAYNTRLETYIDTYLTLDGSDPHGESVDEAILFQNCGSRLMRTEDPLTVASLSMSCGEDRRNSCYLYSLKRGADDLNLCGRTNCRKIPCANSIAKIKSNIKII